MPVLAPLRPLFAAIRSSQAPDPGLSPAQLRELSHAALEKHVVAFYEDVPPLVLEQDRVVPVPGGSITVRIYSASQLQGALPCHVYFHGGGFWLGRLDHFDKLCRATARDAGCIVASVDYRLAPEYKFPVATEDSYAAYIWIRNNAGRLGIDPARISVGGVSAGGNLAAVAAMMARDRGVGVPVLQVLEVPITDLSDWSSLMIPAEDLELPSGKDTYCAHYLVERAQAKLPYASPLLAADFSALPPALILCAEYDPLAAEGKAYAERLARAGVDVDFHRLEGQFHGAQPMAKLIPEEATAYQEIIAVALRRAYGTTGR